MTLNEKRVIIQSLLSLFGKVELHTPKDRTLIAELYKMIKEIEDESTPN